MHFLDRGSIKAAHMVPVPGYKFKEKLYESYNSCVCRARHEETRKPVIITDQRMPEMTGIQFLEKIIPDYPHCIPMILTGFSYIEAIIQAINTGRFYRYITKPWNKEELKMNIDKAIETYQL